MKYSVFFTQTAREDVDGIIEYLLSQDEVKAAEELSADFDNIVEKLKIFPDRGHTPPELAQYPDARIKEIHIARYRVIYRIGIHDIFIMCIVDARRNIASELVERALKYRFNSPS